MSFLRTVFESVKGRLHSMADEAQSYAAGYLGEFRDPALPAAACTMASPFGAVFGACAAGPVGAAVGAVVAPVAMVAAIATLHGAYGALSGLVHGRPAFAP